MTYAVMALAAGVSSVLLNLGKTKSAVRLYRSSAGTWISALLSERCMLPSLPVAYVQNE